ncbi:putative dsRNA-binding protein [Streptosporangium canum]|uniref:putative dsRNA-binding protein n=1 Tax=Streptosporangium canum TaxID=324952 RepID=UPI00343F81FB
MIEIAQTLLGGGMTIREAAESLNVQTFTLKAWLKEAGIQIGQASIAHAAASTSTTATPMPGEHHPVSVLNEWTQQGRIDGVDWQVEASGPLHTPAFTATATTRPAGTKRPVSAQGSGASKAAARAAAAVALLARLDSPL